MASKMMRAPFIGARYERNWPTGWLGPDQRMPWYDGPEGLPVRVTVLNNRATYFGCPGVLVSMPWDFPFPQPKWRTTDEVTFDLERFLSEYHPIENVVTLANRGRRA